MANTHGDIEKSSIGESKDVYIHNYKDENSHPEHVTQVEARLSEYAKHIDDIEFTEEESRRVGRKMDINLMALLLGLQISFYLDKSNIGNANTAGMSVALGLTSAQYTALLTIFYCVYLCFQWQVVLFKVFPVHIWVAFAAVGWGTASVAQAGCHNFAEIVVCRVLLAIFEAAVGPGISLYISMMWTRGEYGFRWALYQCAAALGNCFAGALAYGLVQAKTSLAPWRLVFLVEGLPTLILVPFLFFWLPDAPDKCRWFTERENQIARARIERKSGDANEKLTFAGLIESARDPWTWFAGVLHFLGSTSFNSIAVFCSQIVKDMGFTSINAQGLQAPPFFIAFVVGVTAAYFSDRAGKRGPFIIVASICGGIGYTILVAVRSSQGAKYFGVILLASGVYTSQPLMYAWCSNNVATKSKRAFTMAIFSITGQCGSVLGTNVYPSADGPLYIKGNSVCAGACYLTVVMTIVGMLYLHNKNKKKDALYGKPDPNAVVDVSIHGESSPQWRFML